MVIQHAGAEDHIHFADLIERVRPRDVAEHELDARSTRAVLLLEFRRGTEYVHRRYSRCASFLGDECVFAVHSPHAADVRERAAGRVPPDVFRQAIVAAQDVSLPRPPSAPEEIKTWEFE